MQNKAHLLNTQMNVCSVKRRDYENQRLCRRRQNKPKTNPIKPNLQKAKMNVGSVKTRDYGNKRLCRLRENKPNSNPKQTQSNPIFTKKLIFLAILSAEFCSNARLAASAERSRTISTSSIGRSCVTQQLGKITAQNQKYTIRYTFFTGLVCRFLGRK